MEMEFCLDGLIEGEEAFAKPPAGGREKGRWRGGGGDELLFITKRD